jgi:hypothetical protein
MHKPRLGNLKEITKSRIMVDRMKPVRSRNSSEPSGWKCTMGAILSTNQSFGASGRETLEILTIGAGTSKKSDPIHEKGRPEGRPVVE